jgi:hypothetical protein
MVPEKTNDETDSAGNAASGYSEEQCSEPTDKPSTALLNAQISLLRILARSVADELRKASS